MQHLVTDSTVRGVIIDVRDVGGGQAALQDLRAAMLALREEGRAVFVHVHSLGWRELLLASAADRVWMTPCGEAFLTGMAARLTYYGQALERLGVKADLVAVGRFKTFGEPYLRGHPSRANRTQLEQLLGDLQDQTLEMIAQARGLEVDALRALLGRAPLSADQLVEAGLIDGVQYPDASSQMAQELLGTGWRIVPARVFARLTWWSVWMRTRLRRRPQVAVVHLRGPIVQGADGIGGRGHRIDSDAVVPVLLNLANDPSIQGVVLAVSSPGGSALASDLIARVVQRMTSLKPVVASFGDYAASGGYYLAAPASEIVARPGTVTGSIGVVGGKVVVGRALSRLGIHSEAVEVGPDSGFLGPFEPFDHSQRRRFMASLERAYTRFLGVVSGGRRMPVWAVEPHAAGRVWTGRQALERGLVDHLGGLDLALVRLQAKMPISDRKPEVLHVTFEPSRLESLQRLMSGGLRLWMRDLVDDSVLSRMGRGGLMVRYAMSSPTEPLALMPWDISG
jgi:protease-4